MAQGSDSLEDGDAAEAHTATDQDAATPTPPLFATTQADGDTGAPTPALGGDDLLTPASSIQLIGSLALVLVVIVALGWLSRRLNRLQPRRGAKALRVVDVLPVGARERVALVQVGSTQLVLGLAPGRVQTLHVLEGHQEGPSSEASDDAQAPANGTPPTPFASLLKR